MDCPPFCGWLHFKLCFVASACLKLSADSPRNPVQMKLKMESRKKSENGSSARLMTKIIKWRTMSTSFFFSTFFAAASATIWDWGFGGSFKSTSSTLWRLASVTQHISNYLSVLSKQQTTDSYMGIVGRDCCDNVDEIPRLQLQVCHLGVTWCNSYQRNSKSRNLSGSATWHWESVVVILLSKHKPTGWYRVDMCRCHVFKTQCQSPPWLLPSTGISQESVHLQRIRIIKSSQDVGQIQPWVPPRLRD